jgi:hypothetical protein
MIRLALQKQPYDLTLPHGVTLTVRPLTTAVMEAARGHVQRRIADLKREIEGIIAAGGTVSDLPDLANADQAYGFGQQCLVQELAAGAITAWQGVGDEAGKPLPVTPAAARELMRVHTIAEAFLLQYVDSWAQAVTEGNVSAPSPSGISLGALPTVGHA